MAHDDSQNPMEDLQTVKRRISRDYLGTSGIHAVGTGPFASIRVYVAPGTDMQDAVFRQIAREASPHPLEIVTEEPASGLEGY